ncbi:MAG: hypothetical protein WC637_08795, partial [Victivallales bacterium]
MKKTTTDSKLAKSLFNQGMKYYRLAQEFPYYSLVEHARDLFNNSLIKNPANKECFLKYLNTLSYYEYYKGKTRLFIAKLIKQQMSSLDKEAVLIVQRKLENFNAPDPDWLHEDRMKEDFERFKNKIAEYNNSNTSLSHLFSGYCYESCNEVKYVSIIEGEYLKSIELDENHMTPYIYLIRYYFKTGKIKEGQDLFLKANEKFKNIELLFRLSARDIYEIDIKIYIKHMKDISEKLLLEYVNSVEVPPEDIYSTYKLLIAYSDLVDIVDIANSPEKKKYYYLKYFEYYFRYANKAGDRAVLSYLHENFRDQYICLKNVDYIGGVSVLLDLDDLVIEDLEKILSA